MLVDASDLLLSYSAHTRQSSSSFTPAHMRLLAFMSGYDICAFSASANAAATAATAEAQKAQASASCQPQGLGQSTHGMCDACCGAVADVCVYAIQTLHGPFHWMREHRYTPGHCITSEAPRILIRCTDRRQLRAKSSWLLGPHCTW